MCPLIRDLAAASVCCGSGTLRADIKACVFYIWQAPDPGPPALTVHLSKTIRFPTVTNPAWTFLAYTWEGGGKIQARVSASRRRLCLFTAATLTEMLLERHRDRLDLVCLRVTTSNIRVSLFCFFFRRQPSESLHLIAYVRNANPSLPPCEPLTWVAMVSKPRIRRSMWQHVVKVQR